MPYKIHNRVYVSYSPIHGRGLFAKDTLPEDTYIGTYRGIRTKRDGRHVLWVNEEGKREGRNGLNQLRFLNHSDEPNAVFDGFDLFALEDIYESEEITINYNPDEEEE